MAPKFSGVNLLSDRGTIHDNGSNHRRLKCGDVWHLNSRFRYELSPTEGTCDGTDT